MTTTQPGNVWHDFVEVCQRLKGAIPDPDRIPARLNVAPDVFDTLRAITPPPSASPTFGSIDRLAGIPITIDQDLERGAWQALGPTGTILHDSRDIY